MRGKEEVVRRRLRNPSFRRFQLDNEGKKRKINLRIISSGTTFERPPEGRTEKKKGTKPSNPREIRPVGSYLVDPTTIRYTV